MKPIYFTMLLGLGLIVGLGIARAQSDEKPVPKPPYMEPVPDYGHWKVTFHYKPAPKKDAASATGGDITTTTVPGAPPAAPPDVPLVSIETIKTGDLRGVTLTFADGTTKQFTCQGDWVLSSTPKGPQLGFASQTEQPYGYYTTGFILLDGVTINMSTFKEAAKHNDVMAFHYKSGNTDVWIDPYTLHPLAAKQEDVEVSYDF